MSYNTNVSITINLADLKTFFTDEIEPHEGSYVTVDQIKTRFLTKYKKTQFTSPGFN